MRGGGTEGMKIGRKKRGRGGGVGSWGQLGRGFDGTLLRQVTRLPAVIAVQLRRLAAVHRNMAVLPTPVASVYR